MLIFIGICKQKAINDFFFFFNLYLSFYPLIMYVLPITLAWLSIKTRGQIVFTIFLSYSTSPKIKENYYYFLI